MQFSKAEPIPALDKVTLGESLVYAHTSYRKPSLPFPPHPILRIFHHNARIGQLLTDSIGPGEVAGLLSGVAFLDQAIHLLVGYLVGGQPQDCVGDGEL